MKRILPGLLEISGDNVGQQCVFDHGDLVSQAQFALFKPGNLQLVGRSGQQKRIDRRVQIAVFGFQAGQPLAQFLLVHAGLSSRQ